MSSLQDQLLKSGLTTKQKARQANTDKRKKNKQKRSGANVATSIQEQVKQEIAKQQAEKQAKDAALNEQHKKKLIEKEQLQRILQILSHHQVTGIEGEIEYNYTFEGKVKKLFIDEKTQMALAKGRLSIGGLNGVAYVVTAETADKVATIDESVILLKNEKINDNVDEADPYAAYQIPDDLMW